MTDRPGELPGALAGLTPCYWGSVNQWECDENDHLNVRFYAHKVNQALQVMAASAAGALPRDVPGRIVSQHVRFIRESRVATPLRVDCAITAADARRLSIVAIMHDHLSGELVAAVHSLLDAAGWDPARLAATAVSLPQAAQPKGIDPQDLLAPPGNHAAALAAGYRIVGQGVIAAEECGPDGRLLPHGYVGRISDGMPNLWAFLNPPNEHAARQSGELGGAALEQRLDVFAPLACGSVFTQLSGVRSIGNKTQQMVHLLYDQGEGRCAARMEAIGIAMDLTTRRSVPISAARRRHLEGLLLRS